MKKIIFGLVLLIPAAVGLMLPVTVASAGTTLTMATIDKTSDTYMLAVGWSTMLKKTKSGIAITPLEGGGTVKLLRGVAMGKWDIGFISTPHYLQSLAGKKKFKKDPPELREKYKNIRSLFGVTSGFGHYVVRADSGIKEIKDLKGKKVALGQPGGGGATITPLIFKAHGVEAEKDYTPQFLTASAALDEMRNHRNDMAAVWGGLPQAAIYNFSRKIPVHFLSLDKNAFETFKKEMPKGEFFVLRTYSSEELRAVYGDGLVQKGNVNFFTFQMQVVTRADMPEDVAYKIVKTFWENISEIKSTGAALSNINKDDSLETLSAELHPGALKYYKEKGWLR